MQRGKRSKNFTEREKILLMRVAKEFVHIIDNKKTDGNSIEEKKQAWNILANKYNAASETGFRNEKQLHALYDNLKKKGRKSMGDDKLEMSKTDRGLFCPKTNIDDDTDENVLTPNNKESSEVKKVKEYTEINTGQDFSVLLEGQENLVLQMQTPKRTQCLNGPTSPQMSTESTPKIKVLDLTETKNTNNLSTSLLKIKNQSDDAITSKKLEILEIQKQQELVKLEKTKVIMDIDIELKKVLLEKEKLDLELKKKHYTS